MALSQVNCMFAPLYTVPDPIQKCTPPLMSAARRTLWLNSLVLIPLNAQSAAAVPEACPCAMQLTVFLLDIWAYQSDVISMPDARRLSIPFTRMAMKGNPYVPPRLT